jgi:hypothetical protein
MRRAIKTGDLMLQRARLVGLMGVSMSWAVQAMGEYQGDVVDGAPRQDLGLRVGSMLLRTEALSLQYTIITLSAP